MRKLFLRGGDGCAPDDYDGVTLGELASLYNSLKQLATDGKFKGKIVFAP